MSDKLHPDYRAFCENPFTRLFQKELIKGMQLATSALLQTTDAAQSEREKSKILTLQYILDLPDKLHADLLQATTAPSEEDA